MLKFAGFVSVLAYQVSAMEFNAKEKLLNFPMSRHFGQAIRDAVLPGNSYTDGSKVITVTSQDDYQYGVNITIGTPPQTGYLLVQNESPDLFIFGSNCLLCD